MKIPVYILAGGKSSRFGSDKARAIFRGETLIARIAREMEPVASVVTVVADRPGKYGDLGLRTIADLQPGLGPMGGLMTALNDCEGGWIFVTACDMVAFNVEWVRALLAARADHDAVIFAGEHPEPLFALYHKNCISAVRSAIERNDLALWRLVDSSKTYKLPLPADWPPLAHVNTAAELQSL